jgi:hypothetical protein
VADFGLSVPVRQKEPSGEAERLDALIDQLPVEARKNMMLRYGLT